jgi:hypothetical protein
MRTAALLMIVSFAGPSLAALPPPTEEAKAQAAATKAKSDWGEKVAAYKLCREQDRVAERYRATLSDSAKTALPRGVTPTCVDPGPYVADAKPGAKPLEAAGAHSPPMTATSPHNTNATHSELTGGAKK